MLVDLKTYSTQIGKAIGQKIDENNPEEIKGKIEELSSLLALSSHAVALSEKVYNLKVLYLMDELEGYSATEKKMMIQGRASEEIYYLTLSERQNKALTHKIDGLRSILSYIKEELNKLNG